MEQLGQQPSLIMDPVIEKGSTVLVTGVNGYIASHVADQLLQAGYKVHGTVRAKSTADWQFELFEKKYGAGKFTVSEVADFAADGAFDDAVKGVSGIAHVASILTFSNKVEEVIPPVVKGTLNILTAASKEPSVKSVVYMSSSTAALMPKPNERIIVTKETWDEEAIANANKPNPDGFTVYGASKTEAEKAFWKAVKESHAPFQAATVLPNCNIGSILKPGGEKEASTASMMLSVFNGASDAEGAKGVISMLTPQWAVDVQDTARLTVAALIDPSCNGERIFAFAEPFNWTDVLGVYKKLFPGKDFLDAPENEGRDLSEIPNGDAELLLKKHYGKGFTGLEESLKNTTATVKA